MKIGSSPVLSSSAPCDIIPTMKTTLTLFGALSLLLTGCWTLSETEYPAVNVPEGKGVRVKLSNFRTGVYDYVPVEGHESMATNTVDELLVGQARATQTDMSWMMQFSAAGRLVSRSVAELKRKGYVIDIKKPQYVIEVKFAGPTMPDYDVMRQLGYAVCTLFTAENMIVTWTAQLKVRDGATNKVLYTKDFEQTYDVVVWGPIPVASPACCGKISYDGSNSWALTALNDLALADATTFIAGRTK